MRVRGWCARKRRTLAFSENTNNKKTEHPIFSAVLKWKQCRAIGWETVKRTVRNPPREN